MLLLVLCLFLLLLLLLWHHHKHGFGCCCCCYNILAFDFIIKVHDEKSNESTFALLPLCHGSSTASRHDGHCHSNHCSSLRLLLLLLLLPFEQHHSLLMMGGGHEQ